MTTNYSLRRSVESCAIGGKCSRLNRMTDRFLKGIFGDFHWEGPRNWFGSCNEGAWVRFGDMDSLYVAPLGLLMTFSCIWIYTNTGFKDIIIYIAMGVGTVLWMGMNAIKPGVWFEGFGSGYIKYAKANITRGIMLGIAFVLISLMAKALEAGEIIEADPTAQVDFINTITEYIVFPLTLIIFIPYIENVTLGAFFTPSLARYIGTLPAIVIMSIGRGIWHLTIFHYSTNLIIMSILYGLIVYPKQLAYKSKLVGWSAHSTVNLASYLSQVFA